MTLAHWLDGILLVFEKTIQHVQMAHFAQGFRRCAKFDVIIRRGGRSTEQPIGTGPHELRDLRAPRPIKGFEYAGLVEDYSGEVIGLEVVQPLVIRDVDPRKDVALCRLMRFDIELLANRLVAVIDWVHINTATAAPGPGLFGASTGAAAALIAAAKRPEVVGAVVSRGGRPDLAGDALPMVRAPTLLIVGGNDCEVIRLNQAAMARLKANKEMTIVRGATHLFEEPGALEEVARLAGDWFVKHLGSSSKDKSRR